eukprot:gene19183-25798_t
MKHQAITIPAGPSHLHDLQKQLKMFSQVETLTLACGSDPPSPEDATGHDVVRLFRACSPSSANIRRLCFADLDSCLDMALHSLPSSIRQTLVDVLLLNCRLDGPAFLTLADCHNLTTLEIVYSVITSTEATESIACLTQDLTLGVNWALQDSDAEALAGLSALTRLELGGPMELTRQHCLPILNHLSFTVHGDDVPLRQLDQLIGGSTSMREIVYKVNGHVLYNIMSLNVSAMHNNVHDISTALRSVSLALQQCCVKTLNVDNIGHEGGGRLRLDPQVAAALAPLAATLEDVHLTHCIVDAGAIRSLAQHLLHLRVLHMSSCTMVKGSRAALHKAGIELKKS